MTRDLIEGALRVQHARTEDPVAKIALVFGIHLYECDVCRPPTPGPTDPDALCERGRRLFTLACQAWAVANPPEATP